MLDKVVQLLVPRPGGLYVDATVGDGGHALGLLAAAGEHARLIGIDRDPEAVQAAQQRLAPFGSRARVFHDVFWNLGALLEGLGVSQMDGCLFDLGVSSRQLDLPMRGFSHRQDGPLDMRMDPSSSRTAFEVVNTFSEADLARTFRLYGEERQAASIARAICTARRKVPIERTVHLRQVIASTASGSHLEKTMARVFQAIRIEVNDELAHLAQALTDAISALRLGGRIAAISYHSLEDRTVKHTFAALARGCVCPPDLPVCGCGRTPVIKTFKDTPPSPEEIANNPRARSARLRAAEKVGEQHDWT